MDKKPDWLTEEDWGRLDPEIRSLWVKVDKLDKEMVDLFKDTIDRGDNKRALDLVRLWRRMPRFPYPHVSEDSNLAFDMEELLSFTAKSNTWLSDMKKLLSKYRRMSKEDQENEGNGAEG